MGSGFTLAQRGLSVSVSCSLVSLMWGPAAMDGCGSSLRSARSRGQRSARLTRQPRAQSLCYCCSALVADSSLVHREVGSC